MKEVSVRYPADSSAVYEFEISDGLCALCRGLAYSTGTDIGKIYSGGVDMAVKLNIEPSFRTLILYLNKKYSQEMRDLREDIKEDI